MALPDLIDYTAPVPPTVPLPPSRATWRPEPGRVALLVHDLQRYFLRPYAPTCPALTSALAATAELVRAARGAGVPIFYTAQCGDQEPGRRGLQADLWGPGMSARPEDTAIVAEVAPAAEDTVLVKHRYSAFAHSGLAERLSGRGRDQLLLTGVYAHIGVTATALDAFQREIQPFLVADAVADFGADQHRRALEQVAGCCGVVTLAADVVDLLGRPGEPVDARTDEPAGAVDAVLRRALERLLGPEAGAVALAEPETDLFELGLTSLAAFELLDELLDCGVDADFGDFTRHATVGFLRAQRPAEGMPART